MRILISALESVNGKLQFNGTPYTGVTFESIPDHRFNAIEINDGLLAPRFAPSQRAWVLSGVQVPVNPPVNASTGRDADDR